MKYHISFLLLLCVAASIAFAGSDNDKVILDKIYNDVIHSLPQSQRTMVDSAFSRTQVQRKQNNADVQKMPGDTAGVNTEVPLPDNVNESLIKMMRQIDTMHQKRILHFMTHDPTAK